MQTVSATYTSILSGRHRAEWKVEINGVAYNAPQLESIQIVSGVFSQTAPTVGACISAEIDVTLLKPSVSIPRMASIRPFVRITNGVSTSEWLPKGLFYIDTREATKNGGVEKLSIHGFDSMLMAEQLCPLQGFPMSDIAAVQAIATFLGVGVDDETTALIDKGYTVPIPTDYTCREILGFIAAAYAGSFIMDDFGNLRLCQVNGFPAETNLLINTAGRSITFGGDRIIV